MVSVLDECVDQSFVDRQVRELLLQDFLEQGLHVFGEPLLLIVVENLDGSVLTLSTRDCSLYNFWTLT